ncbi:hypothetical protein MTO96_019767 [Rhipicephalus appendiculatus]
MLPESTRRACFKDPTLTLGAFDECLETVLRDSYGNVIGRGQYCNLLVYSKNATAIESAVLSAPDVLHPRIKYFSNYVTAVDYPLVRMAICFTDDCNQQDLQALVNVGGVMKVVKAFSATSNTRTLLRVADKSNPDFYALQFLHGMRFLCIGHIVSCHCGQTISDNWSAWVRYWWHLLLMIRNYAGTTALDVLPHIWYLSTDFQLFAISLLTLLLFKRQKMLAVGAFITLSLLGCAISTWSVTNSTLLPFMAFPAPNLRVMDVTMNDYYVRPYYHAVCYFSGCITFLLMDDFRNRKISKLSWYRSQTPPTEVVKLLAAFFDRILWSVFLMWVTLACSTGRGGLVNKLLSWNVFVAPSKLSFGVYLIHLPFIRLLLQASRERLFWSTFNVASMYFSVLAWSYVLAYFTYLACEAPTTVLDKLAFARIIQGTQSVHKQDSKPQLNGIDVKPREKAEDGVFSRL